MLQITISRRGAFLIALAIVLVVPLTAYAGSLFDDVDDTSTHFDGIEFMKDSGVTAGCGDGTTFCPDDPVNRAQMATFMYRLSGNDPATDPSVNAATLDGFEASDFAMAGSGVGDADTLDGLDSTDFLGATATAADSGLLDGMDSTDFLGATATAADSDLLDGQDSTAFLGATDQAADADTVDGVDANGLTRVAFAATNDAGLTGTSGTAASGSITAPAAGWLVLSASANVQNVAVEAEIFDCSIYVAGTEVSESVRQIELNGDNTEPSNREENCATDAVVQVAAGTHTFSLRVDAVTGSSQTTIDETVVWAMFVPFDGTGATP